MNKRFASLCWLASILWIGQAIAQQKKLTLEEIYKSNSFTAESIPGFFSLKDGKHYAETDAQGNLLQKSFETSLVTDTLVAYSKVNMQNKHADVLQDVAWSADEQKLLLFTQRQYIYRRSSEAIVFVYDRKTQQTVQVFQHKVMHATLSPNGKYVAYVYQNNLYVFNIEQNNTIAITQNGAINAIINGSCDWVYEEEFGFTKAFCFSDNSEYLAYYSFNETKVPTYSFPIYDSLYPSTYTYKYPKAGEANSVVSLHCFELAKQKTVNIAVPTNEELYIPKMQFVPNQNKLFFATLNRWQNHVQLFTANAETGDCKPFYSETNKAYVDVEKMDIFFLQDGDSYILSSEREGYLQLYLQSIKSNKSTKLTAGKYDIEEVLGVDEVNKKVYFTAAILSPENKNLCVVDLKSNTCKIIDNRLGTHKIQFTSNFSLYVNQYSTATTPAQIAVYNANGKLIREIKNNQKLKNKMSEYALGQIQFFTIPNAAGDSLQACMVKPYNWDSTKKYPVLFCNYGGPGSQEVKNSFGAVNFWKHYLTQQGYIIVTVDNTGTGFKGEAFKKKTYLQLGKYEIEDQIDAAKYLARNYSFIDSTRIGHWGWSFGGFMSSLAITKGANVFKTAVAVAPVTDWRYYDNIYTERFMRTPQDNAKGYADNAPINFVKNIKGKYLIIHGTADDNVHFQHAAMMINEMVKQNIDFESAYYPNKNHGIYGGNTRYHLFKKITQFIIQNL